LDWIAGWLGAGFEVDCACAERPASKATLKTPIETARANGER